jgi:hypothetical protein
VFNAHGLFAHLNPCIAWWRRVDPRPLIGCCQTGCILRLHGSSCIWKVASVFDNYNPWSLSQFLQINYRWQWKIIYMLLTPWLVNAYMFYSVWSAFRGQKGLWAIVKVWPWMIQYFNSGTSSTEWNRIVSHEIIQTYWVMLAIAFGLFWVACRQRILCSCLTIFSPYYTLRRSNSSGRCMRVWTTRRWLLDQHIVELYLRRSTELSVILWI